MSHLPKLARVADATVLLLAVAVGVVGATGGISVRPLGLRFSITSPGRLVVWALVILVLRHVWIRQPSLRQRILASGMVREDPASPEPEPRPASWRLHAAVIGVYCALACVVMLQQVIHLRSVPDLGDPLFSVWRLDWVAYQLRTDPLHLFDANIFHPEPRTLAYSDAMLVPGLVATPWIWMGADPVVVHNLLMLACTAASGVTMFWLVLWLTRSMSAAFVAGAVFAMYPFRWAFYSNLELEVTLWMPLALLFLHRTIVFGRVRDGLSAGLSVALQALSCVYFGMFLSVYLCVVAASLALTSPVRLRRALVPLLCGAAVTGVLVLPMTVPYFQNRATVGQRSLSDVAPFSARPRDYLAAHPRSRLYGTVLRGYDGRVELFPGVSPVALAMTGLTVLSPSAIAYGAALAVAADASLGNNGLTYPVLYRWALPFRGLRAPNRFAVLVGLGLAVLSGYGAARMLRAFRSGIARRAVTIGLVTVVAVEAAPVLDLTPVWRHAPPIYGGLPSHRDAVLVDLPFPQRDGPFWVEYSYLYFATVHHQRLVNGGSGYYPPWYNPLADLMKDFPTDAAIQALRGHGAEYLVVHGAFYEPDDYARVIAGLDARSDLTLTVASKWNNKDVRMYRLSNAQ